MKIRGRYSYRAGSRLAHRIYVGFTKKGTPGSHSSGWFVRAIPGLQPQCEVAHIRPGQASV